MKAIRTTGFIAAALLLTAAPPVPIHSSVAAQDGMVNIPSGRSTAARTGGSAVSAKASEKQPPKKAPSIYWTDETAISSGSKPAHTRTRTSPPVRTVRRLALEWKVLKVLPGSETLEVNPNEDVLNIGDRVQLSIKVNQSGHLYIINHNESYEGQQITRHYLIFPNTLSNDGQRTVRQDQKFILPGRLPEGDVATFQIAQPVGRLIFTLIFSRDRIDGLPDLADDRQGTPVSAGIVRQLRTRAGNDLRRVVEQDTDRGKYATVVTNLNTRENEQLIETVVLTTAPSGTTSSR